MTVKIHQFTIRISADSTGEAFRAFQHLVENEHDADSVDFDYGKIVHPSYEDAHPSHVEGMIQWDPEDESFTQYKPPKTRGSR